MSRRELSALVPLLALYLAVWAFFPPREDDEAAYITLAQRLTQGAYVTGDDDALLDEDPASPDLWFGPGLPGLLAPLVAIDAPKPVLRLTGPLLLFAAAALLYLLARDRWGPRAGLLAAYGFGLYPPFWVLLSSLHSEALAVFFLVAGMLAIARLLSGGRKRYFALAAVALAGLALTRVAYGWVLTVGLAVLLFAFAVSRSRTAIRVASVLAASLLLSVPWLLYTKAKTDRWLVWGNSGSLSLYWMSSPYEGDLGDWRQADDVFTDPTLAPHRSFFEGLRGLTLAEQNAELEREALRNIVHHPAKYAENVLANVSRMLFNGPYSRTPWQANDLFYALPNALLAAAVAVSAVALLPRRRSLPPETGAFVVLGVVPFVLHALVASYPRMVMPLVPIVAWLTTLALVEVGVLRPGARPGRRAPTGSA